MTETVREVRIPALNSPPAERWLVETVMAGRKDADGRALRPVPLSIYRRRDCVVWMREAGR